MENILYFIAGLALGSTGVYLIVHSLKQRLFEIKTRADQFEVGYHQEREARIKLQAEKTDDRQLQQTFENLAHKIFESRDEKFKRDSAENISTVLKPLKDRLTDFQKKIDDSFSFQNKETISLKTELKHMLDMNKKMSEQAENLTLALKGDVKVQGNWGEIMLEKILEESGLRKGQDYILQGIDMGLKNEATGAPLKPDVVVNLPEDKHIIIDSKLSLTHYERHASAPDEAKQALHMRAFLDSIRSHIKDLEKKRYQDQTKLGTPDFVFMFMPIEGAYISAIINDPELHRFAWDRRIVLVGPSTLIATLKTVASIWQLERQGRNATQIAEEGGKLYDKIVGFIEDMERLKSNFKTAQGTLDSAMNKFSEGKGSVLSRTEKMKELGAKASKSLPKTSLKTL
ncbi:MAG: DNA recombination protein RmuC [Alphaproteobacteria bacterium]|nr:DNA recombination protein RmuC [Alphaproteobacteria bacterium]MBN2780102.1 DNA recombination protein RmuC [Alphaproteobacteria bacterium]